ncbi:MAG: hypothetical protein U0353_13375 [Sandaracinus sp.]
MSEYRDETESLRARVNELESKLAASEEANARLRGENVSAAAASTVPDALVGERLHFVSEETLPFEIDEAGFEAIAALLRERRKVQPAQVGRTLTAAGFSLRSSEGVTHVRLETDARGLRASVLAGPPLAGLFGALPVTGLVLDLAQHAAVSPWHLAWAIPAILLGGGLGMRAIAARGARNTRSAHDGVYAAIGEIAARHRVSVAKVRVEAPDDARDEARDQAPEEVRGEIDEAAVSATREGARTK